MFIYFKILLLEINKIKINNQSLYSFIKLLRIFIFLNSIIIFNKITILLIFDLIKELL